MATDVSARLREMLARYDEITTEMSRPDASDDLGRLQELAREHSGLEDRAALARDWFVIEREIGEARDLIEGAAGDREMETLAREELATLEGRRGALHERLVELLAPRDPNDDKNVVIEVRAGTGGDEAALFAADLYRMYTRYAERQRWGVELVDQHEIGLGGFKEIVFEVKGRGAYSRLKYESGVHRVQRVPVTEAQGRIHTSTATVAVLPEVGEIDVQINPEDVRTDIYRSGGAGGQNVNKVESAVRLTHLPTGLVVTCQDERSQLQNRAKAMAVLRARLYDLEQRKQTAQMSETRRSQVGTGERSEKIRTYNFPEDRITDHRVGLKVHQIARVLDGELDPLLDGLIAANRQIAELVPA